MGKYYKGGRLWSGEAFRLQQSKSLTSSSLVALARQTEPHAAAPVSLVSSSTDDRAVIPATARTLVGTSTVTPAVVATKRLLVGTVVGFESSPVAGDKLRLSIAAATYDYTFLGTEAGIEDIYAGLAAVVAAANTGAGDPTFNVTATLTELDVEAKVAGTAANAVSVTLAWVFVDTGTATSNLANTNGIAAVAASPAIGDTLRLVIGAATYDYEVAGSEGGINDIYAGLAAVVAAANAGAGDPTFTVTVDGELDIEAKVAGTAANAVTVTLEWAIGTSETTLTNTNGIAASSGAGVHTVEVQYLSDDFRVHTETVALDGTTPVSTLGDAVWVQRIRWASGAAPVGAVTAALGEVTVSELAAGEVVSDGISYCVPADKQLRLIAVQATADAAVVLSLVSNHDPESGVTTPGAVRLMEIVCSAVSESVDVPYHVGPFPTGTVVLAQVQGANGDFVTAALDAYLEPAGAAN